MNRLMFFDGDRPDMWQLLDDVLGALPTADVGTVGKRWAGEVCEISWRLYSTLQVARKRGQVEL